MRDYNNAAEATKYRHTNALAAETSPYLLQHAHNPVDWHAWGPAAFELARAQNKPIFLSVGYSTCYWCHVMERESFENESVAAEMNRRFISIKVDREERPDVDQLYMTAVQLLTGQGGWPMSVFLLPDLRPFYGGTYFPPSDAHGRASFMHVLRAVDDVYRNNREQCQRAAEVVTARIKQLAQPVPPRQSMTLDSKWIEQIIERSIDDYDAEHGGFGSAPKFPRQTLLQLLLAQNKIAPDDRRQQMVLHSLRAMACGGIRDHLGGAFHRYSTDARWLVPHFEIMLYDNALLAWIYIEAYRQTEDRFYANVARGILDFVLNHMTSPQGAFYTALDAETDAVEGATYLWTPGEVESVLGTLDAEFFNSIYGLDRGPNFADPHHGDGEPDRNVLYLPKPLVEVADELGMSEPELDARLQPMREKLLAARQQRKQPMLDTKILTSWNALMIRAFAYGGQVLGEDRYLQAAKKAADYLLEHHRDADGNLLRLSRHDTAKLPGHLDDYAYFIWALLALDEAGGDEIRRDQAGELAIRMCDQFADLNGALFFTPAGQTDLLVRQKIGSDSPLPSGNAVAAMALLELGQSEMSARILKDFAHTLDNMGQASSTLVEAVLWYVQEHGSLQVLSGGTHVTQAVSPAENPGTSGNEQACTDKGCSPPPRA